LTDERSAENGTSVGIGGSRLKLQRNIRGLLIQALGARCAECGSRDGLEIDHVIPLSRGGTDTIDNITLLCRECHREKHKAATRLTWKEERKRTIRLGIERIDYAALQRYLSTAFYQKAIGLDVQDKAHLECYLRSRLGGVAAIQRRHDSHHPGPKCFLHGDGLIKFARDNALTHQAELRG